MKTLYERAMELIDEVDEGVTRPEELMDDFAKRRELHRKMDGLRGIIRSLPEDVRTRLINS